MVPGRPIWRNDSLERSAFRRSIRDCGFTLLEMMVVIVLMGLIAALAIPRFKDIYEVDLKSSMRRLSGTIKFCFNEAIIKQATMRLNFDIATGTYNYSILLTDPDAKIGEFVEIPSMVAEPGILPDGVFFVDILTPRSPEKQIDGETNILFFSTGYAEKAVIHLGDRKGRRYTLLVKPLTGGVRIFEGYIDFAELNRSENPLENTGSPFE